MATSTWTQLFPAFTQPVSGNYGLAWDASRNIIVMAGGDNVGDGPEIWDGTNWANDGAMPTEYERPAVVYDVPRAEVVVFGGVIISTRINTTHTRGAGGWVLESPATSPGNRAGAYGAYCAAISKVIIFGGWNGGTTYYDETWSWNGTTWAQIVTANAPSPRESCLMCEWGTGVLLFGGVSSTSPFHYDDTWFFDGTDWTELSPATTPHARANGALALYESVGKAIMFAGKGNFSPSPDEYLDDTWSWDGSDWTLESPSVSPSQRHAIKGAWDGVNDGVLIWGGEVPAGQNDETWIFQYEAEPVPPDFYTILHTFGLND